MAPNSSPLLNVETAQIKVRLVKDAWNSCQPEVVLLSYSADCYWRNRGQLLQGHAAIKAFLTQKWNVQLHYRLQKELWSFTSHRLSVLFESEWQSAICGRWFRTYGNALWELSDDGLIRYCYSNANDTAILVAERRVGFHLKHLIEP